MSITLVSWNIGKGHEPWLQLVAMDADVALVRRRRAAPARHHPPAPH